MKTRFPYLSLSGLLLSTAILATAQTQGKAPSLPSTPAVSSSTSQSRSQAHNNAHSTSKSVVSTSGSAHSNYQMGPAGRWWDDKSTMQAVGLRREQQQKMDELFNANKTAILESYKAFQTRQALLNKLSKDPRADQTSIFAAIDAVNQARASLQKSTTQVMLQIRQVLDAEQVDKLEKLY